MVRHGWCGTDGAARMARTDGRRGRCGVDGAVWTVRRGRCDADGATRTVRLGRCDTDGATRTVRLGRCGSDGAARTRGSDARLGRAARTRGTGLVPGHALGGRQRDLWSGWRRVARTISCMPRSRCDVGTVYWVRGGITKSSAIFCFRGLWRGRILLDGLGWGSARGAAREGNVWAWWREVRGCWGDRCADELQRVLCLKMAVVASEGRSKSRVMYGHERALSVGGTRE
jgi:hypothetical protein